MRGTMLACTGATLKHNLQVGMQSHTRNGNMLKCAGCPRMMMLMKRLITTHRVFKSEVSLAADSATTHPQVSRKLMHAHRRTPPPGLALAQH
jgi:hypothetical protein